QSCVSAPFHASARDARRNGSLSGQPIPRNSENQLQPELTGPWPTFAKAWIARRYIGCFANRAKSGTVKVNVGQTQVCVIEDIEKLRAKLQREAFCQFRSLAYGKVHDVEVRPKDRVAP